MRHLSRSALLACALTLTACSGMSNMFKSKPEAPKTGSLTQRYTMVDAEGRTYGTVELDPVNAGKIVDVEGRLVGYVVAPQQVPPSASAAAPVVVAPVAVPAVAAPTPLAAQPAPAAVPQPSPAYPYGR